jgi:hypothetical protein
LATKAAINALFAGQETGAVAAQSWCWVLNNPL